MGISVYPSTADGGLLCLIIITTAQSIHIVRNILRSILHVVGIHVTSREEDPVEIPWDLNECRGSPSKAYMEEFCSRTPAVRFHTVCRGRHRPEQDCIVCLTEFEPDAEINRLPCGHVFHRTCLEKWLKYWNVTCPLCRTRLVSREEEDTAWM